MTKFLRCENCKTFTAKEMKENESQTPKNIRVWMVQDVNPFHDRNGLGTQLHFCTLSGSLVGKNKMFLSFDV